MLTPESVSLTADWTTSPESWRNKPRRFIFLVWICTDMKRPVPQFQSSDSGVTVPVPGPLHPICHHILKVLLSKYMQIWNFIPTVFQLRTTVISYILTSLPGSRLVPLLSVLCSVARAISLNTQIWLCCSLSYNSSISIFIAMDWGSRETGLEKTIKGEISGGGNRILETA